MERLIWLTTVAILPALAGPAHSQPQYFPLEVGNRWTYDIEHHLFTGDREVWVEAEEDGLFVVRTRSSGPGGSGIVRLSAQDGDIFIELPEEGLVPYYLFGEDSWAHRDLFECDNATVTVEARDEVVETPAGVFTDCLRLAFRGPCADAGLIAQWWAPDVGLVKSVEDNFAGAVTWLLSRFSSSQPFRRGDVNSDGSFNIADMVHLLNHLFQGGPRPSCADVADVNDDGGVDLADPVFGINYLFSGGPPPPAPGPSVRGFDGTPTDPFTCGDPPPGTLPGVSIDLSGNPDTITLEEAAAGVLFQYEVVIENDLEGVVANPLDAGQCDQPHESGLRILETISGGNQIYCLCDTGHCLPPTGDSTTLRAGRYKGSFEWTGRNWRGPSDTVNPMGDPFPPGTYTLELRAEGSYTSDEVPYFIRATVEFELVP